MTTPYQQQLIQTAQQGAGYWNGWRQQNPDAEVDFSDVDCTANFCCQSKQHIDRTIKRWIEQFSERHSI